MCFPFIYVWIRWSSESLFDSNRDTFLEGDIKALQVVILINNTQLYNYYNPLTIYAMQHINFFVYSMSKHSFGPCSLELGPKTPVIMNCAFGYCYCNVFMRGIDPPSPKVTDSLP